MSKHKKPCFAHCHMTPEEFGLYTYARTVSRQSGVFYFDGRSVATDFAEAGKNSIYRIADKLALKGWFTLLKKGGRSKTGTYQATQYVPIDHTEWVKHYPNQCHQPLPKTGQVPVPESGQAPVPVSGTTSPEIGNHQSQFRESPVPESGHKVVKINKKRKESREKEIADAPPVGAATEAKVSPSLVAPKTSGPEDAGKEKQTSSDFAVAQAECDRLCGKSPSLKDVQKFFDAGYSLSEIVKGLRDYRNSLKKPVDVEWMEKKFFTDSAGMGVIEKHRQNKVVREWDKWKAELERAANYDADVDDWVQENPAPLTPRDCDETAADIIAETKARQVVWDDNPDARWDYFFDHLCTEVKRVGGCAPGSPTYPNPQGEAQLRAAVSELPNLTKEAMEYLIKEAVEARRKKLAQSPNVSLYAHDCFPDIAEWVAKFGHKYADAQEETTP